VLNWQNLLEDTADVVDAEDKVEGGIT